MMLHSVCLIAEEEAENIDFLSQVLSINFKGIPRFNAAQQNKKQTATLHSEIISYGTQCLGVVIYTTAICNVFNTNSAYK